MRVDTVPKTMIKLINNNKNLKKTLNCNNKLKSNGK